MSKTKVGEVGGSICGNSTCPKCGKFKERVCHRCGVGSENEEIIRTDRGFTCWGCAEKIRDEHID